MNKPDKDKPLVFSCLLELVGIKDFAEEDSTEFITRTSNFGDELTSLIVSTELSLFGIRAYQWLDRCYLVCCDPSALVRCLTLLRGNLLVDAQSPVLFRAVVTEGEAFVWKSDCRGLDLLRAADLIDRVAGLIFGKDSPLTLSRDNLLSLRLCLLGFIELFESIESPSIDPIFSKSYSAIQQSLKEILEVVVRSLDSKKKGRKTDQLQAGPSKEVLAKMVAPILLQIGAVAQAGSENLATVDKTLVQLAQAANRYGSPGEVGVDLKESIGKLTEYLRRAATDKGVRFMACAAVLEGRLRNVKAIAIVVDSPVRDRLLNGDKITSSSLFLNVGLKKSIGEELISFYDVKIPPEHLSVPQVDAVLRELLAAQERSKKGARFFLPLMVNLAQSIPFVPSELLKYFCLQITDVITKELKALSGTELVYFVLAERAYGDHPYYDQNGREAVELVKVDCFEKFRFSDWLKDRLRRDHKAGEVPDCIMGPPARGALRKVLASKKDPEKVPSESNISDSAATKGQSNKKRASAET